MLIQGIPISEGYAIGKPYILNIKETQIEVKTNCDVDLELSRFHEARELGIKQLNDLYKKMSTEHGESEAKIFEAHKEILADYEMVKQIEDEVKNSRCNAERAVKVVCERFIDIFKNMENPYLNERALDIKDISQRLQDNINGERFVFEKLVEPSIIVAKDLTPSETCMLNKNLVLGIVTELGGTTSHSAIIARLLGIPYVVVPEVIGKLDNCKKLILNGISGEIVIDPAQVSLDEFKLIQAEYLKDIQKYKEVKGLPSETKDGICISLKANIGNVEDIDIVLESDAEGIGLFRTEFIYMNRDSLPTFEEQLSIYKEVVKKNDGKIVTFRTLDIGGDKESSLFQIPKEMNPFLGYRGIRLCLDRIDIFKTQLKAILVAGLSGKVKIMFPMISVLKEIQDAKRILREVEQELMANGIDYAKDIPIGIMIETPSAVIMADIFAKEVDFFSIGTNDLTQYTLSTDRMNTEVAYLYSGYDPAVIRNIYKTAMVAKHENIDISICGELAADTNLLPFWLYCGIDTLSMNSSSIEKVKWYIRNIDYASIQEQFQDIQTISSRKEMESFMKDVSSS